MWFSSISLKLYNKVKGCSGLDSFAKTKIKEYEESEKQNQIVKEKLPIVKNMFTQLQEENYILKEKNDKYISEFYSIYCYANKNDIDGIKRILYMYFKKIDKTK